MEEKIRHSVSGNRFVIEMTTNRFTHDLVTDIKTRYPFNTFHNYNFIEFNLQQVKMIDSSSIGFLFELHNKLKTSEKQTQLIIAVGDNKELKELLHKFQVDLLLNVI